MLSKAKIEEADRHYGVFDYWLKFDGYECRQSFKEDFASMVRKVRKYYGMSKKEFAEYIGVSYYCIVNWEKGRSMPRLDKLVKLSEKIGPIDISIRSYIYSV